MLKTLSNRMAGLLLAAVAFAPASIAFTKGFPGLDFDGFKSLHHPLWWWQMLWNWMPPVRLQWNDWPDFGWSLPGFTATYLLAMGIKMFVYQKPRPATHKWEGEP